MRKTRKKAKASPARGPLARKVIAAAPYMLRTVTQLRDWQATKITAENFKLGVVANDLSHLDPVHAVYTYVNNQLSYLEEELVNLPTLSKFADAYFAAAKEYMPSGPPESPITGSYFSLWGIFDLSSAGAKKESFGTTAIDLCKHLKVDAEFIDILEKIQRSRMGIYQYEGSQGQYVMLRELITNKKIKAVCASGYKGQQGEIWFVRVLPPPFEHPSYNYSIIFTTPYILGKGTKSESFNPNVAMDWIAYLTRNFVKTSIDSSREDYFEAAYEELMKYGLSKNYWNEYIFLSYVNHKTDVITLSGFPDVPSSLPHFKKGYDKWDL